MRNTLKKVVYLALNTWLTRRVLNTQPAGWLLKHLSPRLQFHLLSGFELESTFELVVMDQKFQMFCSSKDDYFRKLFISGPRAFDNALLQRWIDYSSVSRTVVDVGSYLGLFSIPAALVGSSKVLAFEANKNAVEIARRNLVLNYVNRQVEIREVAVSSSPGRTQILVPNGRGLSSGAQVLGARNFRDLSNWSETSWVEVSTLDEQIRDDARQEVDLIKIDVEGHELSVLDGAVGLIESSHPVLFIECLSGENFSRVKDWLFCRGYCAVEAVGGEFPKSELSLHSPEGVATDFIFSAS